MKQHVRFLLSGMLASACWLALLSITAMAQDQDEMRRKILAEKAATEVEVRFQGEMFKMMMPRFGVEAKLVKGAPYSATVESGTVQMLADGNRISKKSTATVYRDGEGRTRRESSINAQGVAGEVFINDPVASANYVLDTQRRVAVKSQAESLMKPELDLVKAKMAREKEVAQEMKSQAEAREMKLQAEIKEVGRMKEMAEKKRSPNKEPLGKQNIEGVECEGTRTMITIPAGAVGNDLPINIVSEEWYSPELQILVLTKQNDPRVGETTYRLTNINRGEPEHSLFEIPADYTVKDAPPPPPPAPLKAKSLKKPEEEN